MMNPRKRQVDAICSNKIFITPEGSSRRRGKTTLTPDKNRIKCMHGPNEETDKIDKFIRRYYDFCSVPVNINVDNNSTRGLSYLKNIIVNLV